MMNRQDIIKLRVIISTAETLITSISKRTRRRGKELAQFRTMLRAERKRGVPVTELARKHGVTSAYIYMIGPTERA